MHGWISLPASIQLIFLFLAPIIGLIAGLRGAHSAGQAARWLAYSTVYSVVVVFIAMAFESSQYPGGGLDITVWAMLVIPVLVIALPTIGIPWAAARFMERKWGPAPLE